VSNSIEADIRNDLREAIVAAPQSGKGAISKLSEVHYSTVKKDFHKWKALKIVADLLRS